jgi:hypothetical protein
MRQALEDLIEIVEAAISAGDWKVDGACDPTLALIRAKRALAQPEQEPNKDGSPCPEFWDWLPKAYNFEGDGNFTKYNMEVAFLAGKQASQPEQEPVAWKLVPVQPTEEMLKAMDECSTEGYDERLYVGHAASVYMAAVDVAPTPPQRTWVGLTDDDIADCAEKMEASDPTDSFWREFTQAIEAKLKEKNT